ncbi:hypothetical protein [Chroococcidiopsis sp. SAG 2025]|uniref:hypothetical protein n=1 Tax=Chroococcidiopsis sp. SAG 2025 TaxID=171389 RepID=UPI0029373C83|nr:hypothetical protein [Chroococcidiopsis sp. SAG 2025]
MPPNHLNCCVKSQSSDRIRRLTMPPAKQRSQKWRERHSITVVFKERKDLLVFGNASNVQ